MIVRLSHLSTVPGFTTRAGFCRKGARVFFARHGLDWLKFRYEGIDAEQLLATGDALAIRLVNHAMQMEQYDGR
ncbi:hypothetical protein [Rhodanobacter sp. BL-MT-08]